MNVLVHHDRTGMVSEAFRKGGHNAHDCEDDVFLQIRKYAWDLFIAFPSCTFLVVTGNRWMKPEYKDRFPNRPEQREKAIRHFMRLSNVSINRICLENPVGIMSTRWRRPDQYVHPYYFGEPHTKKTCLWLKNLPQLTPTNMLKLDGPEYSWHTNALSLSPEMRNKVRAQIAIKGLHRAMAEQWGGLK